MWWTPHPFGLVRKIEVGKFAMKDICHFTMTCVSHTLRFQEWWAVSFCFSHFSVNCIIPYTCTHTQSTHTWCIRDLTSVFVYTSVTYDEYQILRSYPFMQLPFHGHVRQDFVDFLTPYCSIRPTDLDLPDLRNSKQVETKAWVMVS